MNQKHDRYEVALTVALAERAVVKAASDRIFVEFAARVARDWEAIPLPPAAKGECLKRLASRLATEHPDLVDRSREESE